MEISRVDSALVRCISQTMQQPSAAGGRRQTALVTCSKSLIGRVIGRNGETIKALQTFTGALIQIDQTCDPTRVALSGTPQSLNLALSMVHDIVRGTFKGFALLRQATGHSRRGTHLLATKPVYAPGYGLIPPSQLYGGEAQCMVRAGGEGVMQQRGPPTAAAAYPQMMALAPLTAAPPQFVQGMQQMPVGIGGTALRTPVYNVMGGPAYSGPVFLSPIDYTAAPGAPGMALSSGGVTADGGPSDDVILYSDGLSLRTGGTGSRLFQALGDMNRGPGAAGGLLGGNVGGSRADGGLSLGGTHTLDSAAGGGSHGHVPGGSESLGHGTGALLQPGSLVMDGEGALYTYTVDS